MKRIWLLLVAALFAPLAMAQSCQIFVNCSFEVPALSGGYQYNPSAAGIGWTFSSSSGIQSNGSAWHASAAPNGGETAFIQGTGTITQTVTLSAGDYMLLFQIALRLEGVSPYIQPIKVTVDGVQAGSLISPAGTTFAAVSIPFTVFADGAHTITLAGTDPVDKTSFIDVVTLQSSGTPPPPPPPPPPGPTAFVTTESTIPPNSAVPVDGLIAGNAANDVDVAILPKGTGAFLTQVPDATVGGGVKRGPYATDFQRARLYATDVASGYGATISGGANSVASGSYGTVVGGYDNEASGSASIVGGHSSTASGGGSPVAFGYAAQATGDSGVALGHAAVASGTDSVSLGHDNVAARDNSVAIGWASVSDATQSVALGTNATTRGIHGAIALAGGQITVLGDAQMVIYIVKARTIDGTPTQLTTDAVTPSLSRQNVLALPDRASYAFSGRVIARESATGNTVAWKFEGMAKRGVGMGSVVQTSTVTQIAADFGTGTWTVGIFADTSNGALVLQVIGQAGKAIQWVATVETTETVN